MSEPCHHGCETCACGQDPSPLCDNCKVDFEVGCWWRREGEAERAELKAQSDARGSAIDMAMSCRTFEEAVAVLRLWS